MANLEKTQKSLINMCPESIEYLLLESQGIQKEELKFVDSKEVHLFHSDSFLFDDEYMVFLNCANPGQTMYYLGLEDVKISIKYFNKLIVYQLNEDEYSKIQKFYDRTALLSIPASETIEKTS